MGRGIALLLIAAMAWALTDDPAAGQSTACPPGSSSAKDSSDAPLAYRAHHATPIQFEYDSGYFPSTPVKVKLFYYASAGELEVKAAGDLRASWLADQAFPGNPFDIDMILIGLESGTEWESNGGLKYGARYKYNIDVFGLRRFKGKGYVPKFPKLDITFPCATNFPPFALTNPEETCALELGPTGGLPCFSLASLPSSCDPPLSSWNPDFDLVSCCPELKKRIKWKEGTKDTLELKVKGPTWMPYAGVWIMLDANFGICIPFYIDGWSLTDTESGSSFLGDSDVITLYDYTVPCAYAKADSIGKTYTFTQGPFTYDADVIADLIVKIEPVVRACLAAVTEGTMETGAALCSPVLSNVTVVNGLDFNEMDATFEITVPEPVVCDIEPSAGSVPAFSNEVVTWATSWGAPDSCACNVKVYYRTRIKGQSAWSDSNLIADTLNVGAVDWLTPLTACNEAQIKVEFYDPQQTFLAEAWGGTFLIDPDTPQVSVTQPYAGLRYCVGESLLVQWNATDPCTLVSNAIVMLESESNPDIGVSNTFPAGGGIFYWPIPKDLSSADSANIVIDVSDGVHTGFGESGAFEIKNPISVGATGPQVVGGSMNVGVPGEVIPVDLGVGNTELPGFPTPCWDGTQSKLILRWRPGGPIPIGTWRDDGGMEIETPEDSTDVPPVPPGENFQLPFTFHTGDGIGVLQGQVDTLVLEGNALGMPPPPSARLQPAAIQTAPPVLAVVRNTLLVVESGIVLGAPDTPVPLRFALLAGSPNPFSRSTEIRFDLPREHDVRVTVYDAQGRLVRVLFEGPRDPGRHRLVWDGRNIQGRPVGSGVYFCRLTAGDFQAARRLIRIP